MMLRKKLVLCIALLPFLIPVRAAEPLPEKLSDEAFWKTITDFSEEGGYFRFENFLSNELGFQLVIPQLKEITKPGGVYLGVGPEQNFTYIVALQPKIAFIIDIRRQNMLELMMYRAFFELSPDRADFLSRLFARKRPARRKNCSAPMMACSRILCCSSRTFRMRRTCSSISISSRCPKKISRTSNTFIEFSPKPVPTSITRLAEGLEAVAARRHIWI